MEIKKFAIFMACNALRRKFVLIIGFFIVLWSVKRSDMRQSEVGDGCDNGKGSSLSSIIDIELPGVERGGSEVKSCDCNNEHGVSDEETQHYAAMNESLSVIIDNLTFKEYMEWHAPITNPVMM